MVLVTLGGCHLLDVLVACDSIEACKKIVRCSGGGLVRGIVLTPRGSRRATLVERVIELPSLGLRDSCGVQCVDEVCATLLSHQTTK